MNVNCFIIEPVYKKLEVIGWINEETGETWQYVYLSSIGAIYHAYWIEKKLKKNPNDPYYSKYHYGPDGKIYGVVTPNGCLILDSMRSGISPDITCYYDLICNGWYGFLKDGILGTKS